MMAWLRRLVFGVDVSFAPEWDAWLREDYAHWSAPVDQATRERWRDLTGRFVALTRWESAQGLELDERRQVSIAAQATRLLLGTPIDDFPSLGNVLVRRSAARITQPRRTRGGVVQGGGHHIAGQAAPDGSIVLVWPVVQRGAANAESRTNVVYHEFAHRLDMSNGSTDGTPPLGGRDHQERWAEVMQVAYQRVENGASMLRGYAATNPAEFFAVATEAFFCQPDELRFHEPVVYSALRAFYRQDPAALTDAAA